MKGLIKKQNRKSTQKGFSLVEIMVSISIFTVIITTGMGALLSITRTYKISKDRTAVINNIHFALESMIRDIRIGDSYYGGSFSPQSGFGDSYRFNDTSGNSIWNIMGAPSRGQMRYTFNSTGSSGEFLNRYQNDGGSPNSFALINNLGSIEVDNAFFRVVGSDPDDNTQASVFVYIKAEDTTRGVPFVIQTFVSQRNLDV